jgi:hypothetical protein
MEVIEKTVSNLIENQFPSFYKEQGSVFIEFVKQYYKWLETENALKHSRNFFEYKDIDETTEQFLVYFKEKYLKNIQLETNTNTRQLLKHTLDLYRSKGTERSIDLLFKLVFGVPSQVYYPGDDVFTLSSGFWKKQKYLEVNININNISFSGKTISGLTSGATAFVDAVVRKRIKDRIVDVFYISSLVGNFLTDEYLQVSNDGSFNGNRKTFVIGSLNSVIISDIGVGSGYSIGDIVDLNSNYGINAKARVSSINSTIGTVEFELLNGGYGYTDNASVIISEKVLTLSNVVISNTESNNYFEILNNTYQPLANINFLNANGFFVPNTDIYTYHANNVVKGVGKVISTSTNTATNGQIFIIKYSGNLASNAFYTTANAIGANQAVSNGYVDKTVSGNVVGVSSNVTLYTINTNKSFIKDEIIYQVNDSNTVTANGTVIKYTPIIGSNGILEIANSFGVFRNSRLIYSSNSTVSNLDSIELRIGVYNVSSTYTAFNNNYFYANSTNYNTTAVITTISTGSGADFNISNDMLYEEFINFNSDSLSQKSNVALNVNYNFTAMPTANLSTILNTALTYANTKIGKINFITGANPGSGYSYPPFVLVYDPKTYRYERQDKVLTIANNTALFLPGEIVTQNVGSNAFAIVKSFSNNELKIEKLLWNDVFAITTNIATRLFGQTSGAFGNITSINVDYTTDYLGFNAIVDNSVQISNGAISGIQVIDSGFGFLKDEIVDISSSNNDSLASGIAVLRRQGEAEGFYKQKGGFLSDQKKLFDGNYYQDYSYEIISSVVLNKYEEMLKNVLHLSGTKYFARYEYSAIANSGIDILDTNITVE